MSFFEAYTAAALVILGLMTVLWIVSLILRDSSIVDIFWGPGFVLTTWVYFALTPAGLPARKWLISGLVTVWGIRLGLHLLRRNWGRGEDFRYARWREEAGPRWWWLSFFKVFLLQGSLMWLLSSPLLAAQISALPERLTLLDLMAIPLWVVGFSIETVADWQLARFKADPANRGKLLNRGLWRYSRHPNYFGEATQWWAYFLFAASVPSGWATVFSPLLMTILLLRVSGVSLLEASLKETKPGYEEYTATTSAFVPWPTRKRR